MWHLTTCKISVSFSSLKWIKNEMIFYRISELMQHWIIKCLFLRNMEPLKPQKSWKWVAPNFVQVHEAVLKAETLITWPYIKIDSIENMFLVFHRKQDLTFHSNCLRMSCFLWNVILIFHRKQDLTFHLNFLRRSCTSIFVKNKKKKKINFHLMT